MIRNDKVTVLLDRRQEHDLLLPLRFNPGLQRLSDDLQTSQQVVDLQMIFPLWPDS